MTTNRLSLARSQPIRAALWISTLGVVVLLIFVAINAAVINTDPVLTFDADLAQAVDDAGHTRVTDIFEAITWAGSQVLYVVGFGLAFVFVVRKMWTHLTAWALVMAVGKLINVGLKEWFARPRPEFSGKTFVEVYGFPSGHVMMSVMTYGMLAVFAWQAVRHPLARALIVKLVGTVIVLVGISRIVLNVHFISDVIGGLVFGGIWLATSALVFMALQARADDPAARDPAAR